MAGSPVCTPSENQEKSIIAISNQWEIQYSRFVHYPSLPSTHPALTPRSHRGRYKGTWISSFSSAVSLELLPGHSGSDSILLVSLRQRSLEEHYISKLHFSWPQVSCLSGFPARGSRVLFVSYNDCSGQIEKFALRFLTHYEIVNFMNALKDKFDESGAKGLPRGEFKSEITSQSDFISSNVPPYRPEECSMISADNCTHPMSPNLSHDIVQHLKEQETTIGSDAEAIFSAFPPSFTSLLMNCRSPVEQAVAQPAVSESKDVDLKIEIKKYLEDSSFQDILNKVEKVISEMGDDIVL